MLKRLIFVLSLGLFIGHSFAQKDEVIMSVNGTSVTASEFLEVYLKNNDDPKYDKASLDEYMDLYRKFKLIVTEANSIKLDTTKVLYNELKGYERQLAKQYLTDNEATEELVKEAYDHLKTEVRASHILRTVKADASPNDTLMAYEGLMRLRKEILDGKKTFAEASVGIGGSEDPSAKTNKGDLGYFGAFQMVYEFEKAAFGTKEGEISLPVRTKFGYHLIYVTGKRPARGTIKVEHIMLVGKPAEQKAREKMIVEIYDTIQKGLDFKQAIMLYSEDLQSKKKGGVLPEFGTGSQIRMVPEFEEVAFSLKKDGEVSKPFSTSYGWHLIRRVSLTPVKPYDELKRELKLKVSKDGRSEKSEISFINKLKKEYKFKDYSSKNLQVFIDSITDDIFNGKFEGFVLDGDQPLFKFNGFDKVYTQSMFLAHVMNNQEREGKVGMSKHIHKVYNDVVGYYLKEYEKTQLGRKYPKYTALMSEYRDGVLLFELKNRNVWKKAIEDTTGLKGFFESNKNQYVWPERVDVVIYECFNKEAVIQLKELIKTDLTPAEIRDSVNSTSQLNMRVSSGKFVQNENDLLKGHKLKKGINSSFEKDSKIIVVDLKENVSPENKKLKECRGQVIASYQDKLEKEWISKLEKKYTVVINEDVLYSLSK